ncbi:MAG: hypothetical protein Q9Q40_14925 [Acidobacteriota bacterium]|nr:hypothetical protein [Acidobacteriota bacterium]
MGESSLSSGASRSPLPHEWEAFCSRLRELQTVESQEALAADLAVERLQRAVRSRIGHDEKAPVRRNFRRFYALAAAVLPAALGLSALYGAASPASRSPSLVLTARADGSISMRYSDGRPIRRVAKSEFPSGVKLESLLMPARTEVVDKVGEPRPGTVVFYRVD